MALSNHEHSSATDAQGESQLPRFMAHYHSLSARALNTYYGRGENFWRDGSYSNVEVRTYEDMTEQLLYLWTQPVKDGLVEKPEDWPGVKFLPEDFGREIVAKKPEHAFFGGRRPADWEPGEPKARRKHRKEQRRKAREERREAKARKASGIVDPPAKKTRPPRPSRSKLPDEIRFTISRPPGFENWDIEDVRAHFRKLLDQRLEEIHAQRAKLNKPTMGVARVMDQSPFAGPGGTIPTFALDPRIAAKEPALRVHLLLSLREWRATYRRCLKEWRAGNRDVVFPAGTHGMHVVHGVEVRVGEPVTVRGAPPNPRRAA